ncbi:MAG: hypothetical protein ACPHV3_05275 [Vibrio sp.]
MSGLSGNLVSAHSISADQTIAGCHQMSHQVVKAKAADCCQTQGCASDEHSNCGLDCNLSCANLMAIVMPVQAITTPSKHFVGSFQLNSSVLIAHSLSLYRPPIA